MAIYARYSSDRQSENSIEDQLRICRARAQREGWNVVSEFKMPPFQARPTIAPAFAGSMLLSARVVSISCWLKPSTGSPAIRSM